MLTVNGIRQGLNSLVDTYHNIKQDIALLDSGADKTVTRHLDLLKNSTLESFSAENPGIYLQAANGERMNVTHSGDISPYITDALRSHDVGDITLVSASEIREMDVGSILLPRSMIPQGCKIGGILFNGQREVIGIMDPRYRFPIHSLKPTGLIIDLPNVAKIVEESTDKKSVNALVYGTGISTVKEK